MRLCVCAFFEVTFLDGLFGRLTVHQKSRQRKSPNRLLQKFVNRRVVSLEVPLLRGIRGSPKTRPNSAQCGLPDGAWTCAACPCSPAVWVRLWAAGICWSSAVIFSMRLSHRVGGSRVVPTPCARVPCSCSWYCKDTKNLSECQIFTTMTMTMTMTFFWALRLKLFLKLRKKLLQNNSKYNF